MNKNLVCKRAEMRLVECQRISGEVMRLCATITINNPAIEGHPVYAAMAEQERIYRNARSFARRNGVRFSDDMTSFELVEPIPASGLRVIYGHEFGEPVCV